MSDARYQKALKFIYDRQHFGIKLGLENVLRLVDWLGNPQNNYPTIHIAGSNGKGSTSSFIASILEAEGYKVGLYTSPHLADYRERIRVNGKKIASEAITAFVEKHKPQLIESQATFFEVTTALAFWYFDRQKVDWVVLETGLGGRLDATNIVTPTVSVITNISLEHTNILGRTVYKIAGEKAGIIKPGVPVVTGVENNGNAAARCFREVSGKQGAPLSFLDRREFMHVSTNGAEVLLIKDGPFAGLEAELSLLGRHQIANAFLAVRAAAALLVQGVRVSREAVRRGLERNYWPGRFMTVRVRPRVIIDVAHNQEGFVALTDTLKRCFQGRKFDFLICMVEKKKGDRCLPLIAPLARSISTAPLDNPRSDDPYFLISRLRPGRPPVRVFPSAMTACKDLLENSAPSDILVIAGSHFTMGEIASLIKRDGF